MRVLVYSTFHTKNSNSWNLLESLKECISIKGHEATYITYKDSFVPCTGCNCCKKISKCKIRDELSEVLKDFNSYDAIIFLGQVYFFSINSRLSLFLERLYAYDLKDKILGLVLSSGSNFRYGGVDHIIEQFQRIDEYCGSITVTPFNKITYDLVTDSNECDRAGIDKLLTEIEAVKEENSFEAD